MENQMNNNVGVSDSTSAPRWRSIGQATYITTIIFGVLCSIAAVIMFVLGIVTPNIAMAVVAIPYLAFCIVATVIICRQTKSGLHLNIAFAICSLIFFSVVVGVLAVVYSALVEKGYITYS